MCKRLGLAALAVCVGLVFSGCISTPQGVSSSTKPLAPGGYTELGNTTGKAFGVILFGIPLSEPTPARSAVDRAIASGGGDAMINVTMDMTQVPLGIVSFIWTTVKGTAVRSAN